MEYINLQEATNLCLYSQEYLSLRARQGKLRALKIGRNWSTTKEWLQHYIAKSEEYKNSLNRKRRAREIDPPRNLPIYALDADMWEENTPEEVARQNTFQRKLQFAGALGSVVLLFLASVFQGQEQMFRVAENVSPITIFSAATLQQEIQDKGFMIGTHSIEFQAGIGEIMREYFDWLQDQIRGFVTYESS